MELTKTSKRKVKETHIYQQKGKEKDKYKRKEIQIRKKEKKKTPRRAHEALFLASIFSRTV